MPAYEIAIIIHCKLTATVRQIWTFYFFSKIKSPCALRRGCHLRLDKSRSSEHSCAMHGESELGGFRGSRVLSGVAQGPLLPLPVETPLDESSSAPRYCRLPTLRPSQRT